jgi:hypothetical protein
MRYLAAVTLCMGLWASIVPVIAQDHPTYQSLWAEATSDQDCKASDYPDFTLVTCNKKMTLWYFTKPNHPAHPGVIKRSIEQGADGSGVAHEDGYSFGPDSVQPAFKMWLAQIADLDRQAREKIENERGAAAPPNSN